MWNFRREETALLSLLNEKGEAMKKTLMALAAVATLAVSAVAAPQAAEARGGRVAAGVAAGLIGPGYGYYGGGPAYVAEDYGCYWQRQRFWDGYGWRVRRVRVCG
jgi:hypothetical protein